MLLSRKFLNDYVDVNDIDTKELADKMTNVGNEYDKVGKLINATNITVGEVLECEMHPDSDHLHVCKVQVSSDEVLQIVCGAPNVRKGLKVIVALPGAVLPEITIKKGVIRGVESNGMLCALNELGIDSKYLDSKGIDGIWELPLDTKVGSDPREALGMDDECIDFELTSNRGDLLSILGMAYEVGAIYNRKVKDIDLKYKSVDEEFNLNLEVKTDKCPLFLAKLVRNVEIKESPDFIKNRLIASGIRPINNVVDISNYVMLETGQPLHYYDYDKLNESIIVRDAKDLEEVVTLDGNKRVLSSDDIVIASKDRAIGLAGVMGGLDTEVTENTKNILIESAIFDSISIRLTSKKILRSEASNRFEKGLDPNRTYMAMERSCCLLSQYANGEVLSDIKEYNTLEIKEKVIDIKVEEINKLLGLMIPCEEIIDIYNRLGFKVSNNNETLTVTVPTRRIDISIKEDLIEEVARIYGLEKVEGRQPILPIKKGSYDKFIRNIRMKMINLGLNETLSYTLIPNSESHKYTIDEFEEINLLDPMSDDRRTLRYSIIPSLYAIYQYNLKRNNKDICIFEIGKGFGKVNGEYKETNKLAVLMTGNYANGLYSEKVDFYHLKGVLEELFNSLGFNNRYSLKIENLPKEFHPGCSAKINLSGQDVGYIGKIHPNECKNDVYVLEINLDIVRSIKTGKETFKELSKFPSIVKDVAFIVNKDITNEEIMKEIKKFGGKYLINIELFDLYVGDKIDENKKSLAYNLTFNKADATLTDEEVMPLFEKVIEGVTKKFNCEIRDK